MKKLILFDLDGVLLDSKENMRASWAQVCAATNLDVPFESYFSLIGRPFRDILSLLDITERQTEIEAHYSASSLAAMSLVRFYPGVKETLSHFQAEGRKLGIVTSKDGKRTRVLMDELGIRFDTIQTPVSEYRGKPAPDQLLVAMAETGVDPAETIYIGDMDSDYEAAQRAGIDYVHASWGYGNAIGNIPVAADIRDLPSLIP